MYFPVIKYLSDRDSIWLSQSQLLLSLRKRTRRADSKQSLNCEKKISFGPCMKINIFKAAPPLTACAKRQQVLRFVLSGIWRKKKVEAKVGQSRKRWGGGPWKSPVEPFLHDALRTSLHFRRGLGSLNKQKKFLFFLMLHFFWCGSYVRSYCRFLTLKWLCIFFFKNTTKSS